jgi:flavin-binding protein dodecin
MATVAKVIELVAESDQSFDDAVRQGLAVASETIRGITGLEVKNWTATVRDNRITHYKVTLHIAFGIERAERGGGGATSGAASRSSARSKSR